MTQAEVFSLPVFASKVLLEPCLCIVYGSLHATAVEMKVLPGILQKSFC